MSIRSASPPAVLACDGAVGGGHVAAAASSVPTVGSGRGTQVCVGNECGVLVPGAVSLVGVSTSEVEHNGCVSGGFGGVVQPGHALPAWLAPWSLRKKLYGGRRCEVDDGKEVAETGVVSDGLDMGIGGGKIRACAHCQGDVVWADTRSPRARCVHCMYTYVVPGAWSSASSFAHVPGLAQGVAWTRHATVMTVGLWAVLCFGLRPVFALPLALALEVRQWCRSRRSVDDVRCERFITVVLLQLLHGCVVSSWHAGDQLPAGVVSTFLPGQWEQWAVTRTLVLQGHVIDTLSLPSWCRLASVRDAAGNVCCDVLLASRALNCDCGVCVQLRRP